MGRLNSTVINGLLNVNGSINLNGNISAAGYNDILKTISIIPYNSNEINFGGTNTGSAIFVGYRAADSRPIPNMFVFGGIDGDASIKGHKGIFKGGIDLNNSGANGGIQYYLSSCTATWKTYMSSGSAPGSNSSPAYGDVNSWALRNIVEGGNGYGFTWEARANDSASAPVPLMALSSYNGNLTVRGKIATTISGKNSYFGAMNADYCHFESNVNTGFHMNKSLYVAGEIYAGTSYNQRVYHTGFKPLLSDISPLSSSNFVRFETNGMQVCANNQGIRYLRTDNQNIEQGWMSGDNRFKFHADTCGIDFLGNDVKKNGLPIPQIQYSTAAPTAYIGNYTLHAVY